MAESLRRRLVRLHTVSVMVTVLVIGAAVCYSFWRTLLSGVDRELTARATLVSRALTSAGPGRFDLDLPADLRDYFRPDGAEARHYVIWTAACVIVAASDADRAAPCLREVGASTRDGMREVAVLGPEQTTVVVRESLGAVAAAVRSLAFTIAPIGLSVTALSLLSGWFLAGRALAPISRMSTTAKAMADGDLEARIPIDRTESELGQLAVALNTAFEQLHVAIDRQRRFTADASHDLRTPLAAMRAEIDWALGRSRDGDAYRESLITCRAAATRMSALVERLLAMARLDADELPLQLHRTRLSDVLADAVATAAPVAVQQGIMIESAFGDSEIRADAESLRQALSNVIWNAVQYSHRGATVAVRCVARGDAVAVHVVDTGIGIAHSDLPHVFDRFYRADKARAAPGGSGLGLSLTKSIVELHGGTVACSSTLGHGTEIVVTIPLA